MARKKAKSKKAKTRKVRCAAKTATGKQCKRYATGKSRFCPSHR
jgi:hypothetical protein